MRTRRKYRSISSIDQVEHPKAVQSRLQCPDREVSAVENQCSGIAGSHLLPAAAKTEAGKGTNCLKWTVLGAVLSSLAT